MQNEYRTLNDINKSDIVPDRVKNECKNKFGKKCYFKYGDNTKIGILSGIELHESLSDLFYILVSNKNTYYIPITHSLTKI